MMSFRKSISEFFTAGGTLRPDDPSYVERPADKELFNLALAGEFCYVLTPRQMGKSSLMARTANRLKEQGVSMAVIDLTKIGTVAVDQWYLGLLTQLKRQLKLSVDPEAWWQEHALLGRVQRFTDFLSDVILTEIEGQVVIFIDEIDTTLKLDFTDDFFAAIRAVYNARADDPEFKRLTFVLLGVATPADLIKDRTRTPFNIGQGVVLQEFSRTEAAVLQAGLEAVHPGQGEAIFTRIYHWTKGHPYLIQKLCLSVVETGDGDWSDERVDRLVEALFLSEEARKETNLQFVQDGIQTSPHHRRLLTIYRQVYQGERVPDDERSLNKTRLKLVGLVKSEGGVLKVRNEIYRRVFNLDWIKANTPIDWTRRIAIASTAIALLLISFFGYFTLSRPQPSTDARAQAFVDTFRETTSTDVRITNLAGLFQIPGYENRARELFFDELTPEDQTALFERANSQAVGNQLIIVVQGLYTKLGDNDQDERLLRAMAETLRQTDNVLAINLATEIEQWLQGRTYHAQGEHQQAIVAYDVAISLNARNPGTYFDRALAYAALDKPNQALADFETVLDLDEGSQVQVRQAVVSDGQLYAALWSERGAYPALIALVPTPTSTSTSTATPVGVTPVVIVPTDTATPTSTQSPTATGSPTPTETTPSTPTTIPSTPPTPAVTSAQLVRHDAHTKMVSPPDKSQPLQCPALGAQITYPPAGSEIRGWVDFRGTADIPGFSHYKIEYRPSGSDNDWAFLLSKSNRVIDGELFEWNTQAVRPGLYDMRLTVVDETGNYPDPCETQVLLTNLPSPIQISPENEAELKGSEIVTFTWRTVEGTAYYGVEVECLGCCGEPKWCPYTLEGPLISTTATLTGPVGRLGRWRVWAVDPDGYPSGASPWHIFFDTLVRHSVKKKLVVPPDESQPLQCPDPGVQITYPPAGSEIRGWVDFRGTADIPNFSSYKIEYRPSGTKDWLFLLRKDNPVIDDGELFAWHTGTVQPGLYDVRLTVVDETGNYPQPCETQVLLTNLPSPIQISPEDQAQLYAPFLRATLTWAPVEGAAYYGVEVECLGCCGEDEWCSYALEGPLISTTVTLTGPEPARYWSAPARLGRWRVWAVDFDGYPSVASTWRIYVHTR